MTQQMLEKKKLLSVSLGSAFCAFPGGCIFLVGPVYYSRNSQVLFFNKNNFKIESHGSIYTFKNYFATKFLVFSFYQ